MNERPAQDLQQRLKTIGFILKSSPEVAPDLKKLSEADFNSLCLAWASECADELRKLGKLASDALQSIANGESVEEARRQLMRDELMKLGGEIKGIIFNSPGLAEMLHTTDNAEFVRNMQQLLNAFPPLPGEVFGW